MPYMPSSHDLFSNVKILKLWCLQEKNPPNSDICKKKNPPITFGGYMIKTVKYTHPLPFYSASAGQVKIEISSISLILMDLEMLFSPHCYEEANSSLPLSESFPFISEWPRITVNPWHQISGPPLLTQPLSFHLGCNIYWPFLPWAIALPRMRWWAPEIKYKLPSISLRWGIQSNLLAQNCKLQYIYIHALKAQGPFRWVC